MIDAPDFGQVVRVDPISAYLIGITRPASSPAPR
jgi:hypothetical protein